MDYFNDFFSLKCLCFQTITTLHNIYFFEGANFLMLLNVGSYKKKKKNISSYFYKIYQVFSWQSFAHKLLSVHNLTSFSKIRAIFMCNICRKRRFLWYQVLLDVLILSLFVVISLCFDYLVLFIDFIHLYFYLSLWLTGALLTPIS